MLTVDVVRSLRLGGYSKSVRPADALKPVRSVNFNKIVCTVNSTKLLILLIFFVVSVNTRVFDRIILYIYDHIYKYSYDLFNLYRIFYGFFFNTS